MNSAGPLPVDVCTTKSLVELNTVPVGAPCGMLTTSETIAGMLPSTPPLYRVETSAPLSATHSGEVGLAACPQGSTRFESVIRATPGMSEIRFVCWYCGGRRRRNRNHDGCDGSRQPVRRRTTVAFCGLAAPHRYPRVSLGNPTCHLLCARPSSRAVEPTCAGNYYLRTPAEGRTFPPATPTTATLARDPPVEPDFLPVSFAETAEVRALLDGWLAWSRERGIDHQIG